MILKEYLMKNPDASIEEIVEGTTIPAMKLKKKKSRLLLGRKVTTNLDSILKSRDIILPTKVCLVKAMFFPVVMHGLRVGV